MLYDILKIKKLTN